MDYELWLSVVGGGALLVAIPSWFAFLIFSVWRIEKHIQAEGKTRPYPWDGIGGRAFWYCWTVALPASFFNERDDLLLNTSDIKRYVRPINRYLGWILLVSSLLMVLCVLVDWGFGMTG